MAEKLDYIQSLTSVLEVFSDNLSVKKLFEQNLYEELISIIMELEKSKYLIHNYEFLFILRRKLFCSYCLENPLSVPVYCEHHLCTACIDLLISQQKDEQLLLCPLCTQPILAYAIANYLQKCLSCQFFLPTNYFYANNICIKYCKLCLWKLFNKKTRQFVSEFESNDKILTRSQNCGKCQKKVLIPFGNYLCRIHFYCFACFKSELSKQRCFCCKSKLSDEFFVLGKKMISSYCGYCGTIKEKIFFVQKNCCVTNICFSCQIKFNLKKCRKCMANIDLKNNLHI